MIKIDGSYGEGGGQILRTSLALSIVTGKPFMINNIRNSRPKPGLMQQHLKCIESCAEFCNAKCENARIGAESFSFVPGRICKTYISVDMKTAGSITLLLQSLTLPAILSGKTVQFEISGGTDVKWSMPYDYFSNVLVPFLKVYADIHPELIQRGYFPKGKGAIKLEIVSKHTFEEKDDLFFDLTERGELMSINGVSHASSDLSARKVAERQAVSAVNLLKKNGFDGEISTEYSNSLCSGSGVTIFAVFSKGNTSGSIQSIIGSDALGERGKSSESVGEDAAKKIIEIINSKIPVDEFLSDNLIPYIAVFGGRIKVPLITGHIKSNLYVTEKFLGKCLYVDEEKKFIIKK